MSLWAIIQGLGAIVGLATGSFVVWDRLFRMAPIAVVVVKPLIPGGITKGIYLQVKNPGDRPLLVSWRKGDRKGTFGIAEDHSIRAIVSSIVDDSVTVLIDAGDTRELILMAPIDVHEIAPDNYIECEIFWSYAQPKIWKRPRRIAVRLPKRSLIVMDPDEYDQRPDTDY